MIRKVSIVLALILTLALPAAAFAANPTAPVAETLTVGSTLTLTGIPSSVNYGTMFAGDTGQAPTITVTANGNVDKGVTLSVDGTDFTTTTQSGTKTLPASIRSWHADPYDNTGQFTAFDAPGTQQTIATTPVAGSLNATVLLQVKLPTNALAGAYSGTVTFTLSPNA